MKARTVCAVMMLAVGAWTLESRTVTLAARGGQAGQKSAFVTVVADAGSPLRELKAGDFVVHEDKATRQVLDVDLATDPLFISLLVDTSAPGQGVIPPTQELRSALANFVKAIQSGAPGSQIAVTEMAGAAVNTVAFDRSPMDVEKAIQRLVPNQQAGAVVLEALSDASKQLGQKPAPRRAIVSIDFNSPEGSAEQTMKRVAEDVHKSGATVWAISIRTVAASANSRESALAGVSSSANTRDAVLNAVTQGSGGMRFTANEPTALDPLLKRIANSLLSQYTVTFAKDGNVNVKALRMETTAGAKVLLTAFMR